MFKVWSFFMQGNNSLYSTTNNKAPSNSAIFTTIVEPFMEGDEGTSSNFKWLGQYIEDLANQEIDNTSTNTGNFWAFFLQSFINRTPIFYNAAMESAGSTLNGYTCPDFATYGHPDYWRPYWAESVCHLPRLMKYNVAMPTLKDWKTGRPECQSGSIKGVTPSLWYQWNIAPDGKAYDQSQYLLAWRDGSTTGHIVHHVSRPDMQLYATYVDKRLQESNPTPDLSKDPYDATNNDVLSLLANDNYGTTVHNVTIDRKFVGGMYNTVCFPFDLPISKLPSELSGAEIRVFNGVTKTYDESGEPVAVLNFITLQEYWQDKTSYLKEPFLQAGMPYLIKPNADTQSEYLTYSLTQGLFFDGTRAPLDTVTNGITFQGVFNPTTITEENAYILVSDNRLAKVTSSSEKIKGYRGYFIINDAVLRQRAAEGRLYFSFKKPVTTSIPVAPEAEQPAQPKVRKVMYDGKIYILRGDEVYTITGHRVK